MQHRFSAESVQRDLKEQAGRRVAVASADFIRATYRVLLRREVEDSKVIDSFVSQGMTEDDVLVAVATSLEFSRKPAAARIIQPWRNPPAWKSHEAVDRLCMQFERYQGVGTKGFFTDFLGVKTSIKFVSNFERYDRAVYDYPSRQTQGLQYDLAEWEGTLRSVIEAKNRITVVELGAGWGPWLVTSAAAARQRGIVDIHLAGVEGAEGHFEFMQQHFVNNGIDPKQHFLFRGVIGTSDGFAHFPKLLNPESDWGAQAVMSVDLEVAVNEQTTKFVDYRGVAFDSLEQVPSLSLSSLLRRYEYVNLIHCDIQDSEGIVIPHAFDELNKRVRRIIIGTHSRQSEGILLNHFSQNGWMLEADIGCQYTVMKNRVVLVDDGVQIWANPRLS